MDHPGHGTREGIADQGVKEEDNGYQSIDYAKHLTLTTWDVAGRGTANQDGISITVEYNTDHVEQLDLAGLRRKWLADGKMVAVNPTAIIIRKWIDEASIQPLYIEFVADRGVVSVSIG